MDKQKLTKIIEKYKDTIDTELLNEITAFNNDLSIYITQNESITEGFKTKENELNEKIQSLNSNIDKLKIYNYELLTSRPVVQHSSNNNNDNNETKEDNITIDDLII